MIEGCHLKILYCYSEEKDDCWYEGEKNKQMSRIGTGDSIVSETHEFCIVSAPRIGCHGSRGDLLIIKNHPGLSEAAKKWAGFVPSPG